MSLHAASYRTVTAPARKGVQQKLTDQFERLFGAEYRRVVAIAQRVLNDGHEAEDVAQEVFLSFHGRHDPAAGYAPAWLHAAAVHRALNRLRGHRRRARREAAQAVLEPEGGDDPEQVYVRAEERRAVQQALKRLPERSAAVLVLRHSGLSYAEVAAAMGIGIGQVGTRLKRAEEAFRREVTRGTSE